MIELLKYSFMKNALCASVFASIICGIIGTIIVEKRLIMMSGGISHASFGGIGLGYFLGIEPIVGAFIFSLIAGLGLSGLSYKNSKNIDAAIGIFWSTGMALGIIFVSLTPGYPPDMTSYLFGDILTVSKLSVILMIFINIIIISIIIPLFDYWKVYLFDEVYTKVIGLKTKLIEKILFVLISLTIVVLIKTVGIILVIALLTIPPTIGKLITYDLKNIMIISIILGVLFCITGLMISYSFNIASGACIVLIAALTYFVLVLFNKINNTKK